MAIQTEPTRIQIPFADSGTKNVIPDTNSTPSASQAASWTDGFPAQCSLPLSAGGIPPARADFNGLFNTMTQSLRYGQEGGVWAWDATVDYGTNRVVIGSDGLLYWSIAQSGPNVGGAQDPTADTSHTYWTSPKATSMPLGDKSKALATTEWVKTLGVAPIYLDPAGSDSNDGMSAANAVQTFARAKNIAKTFSQTNVHLIASGGTYSGDFEYTGCESVLLEITGNVTISGKFVASFASSVLIRGNSYTFTVTSGAAGNVFRVSSGSIVDIRCASCTFQATGSATCALSLYSANLYISSDVTLDVTSSNVVGVVLSVDTASFMDVNGKISIPQNSYERAVYVHLSSTLLCSTLEINASSAYGTETMRVMRNSCFYAVNATLIRSGSSADNNILIDACSAFICGGTSSFRVNNQNGHNIRVQYGSLFFAGGTSISFDCSTKCVAAIVIDSSFARIASGTLVSAGQFTTAFVASLYNSVFSLGASTAITNNSTGPRYSGSFNSTIYVAGRGATILPGNAAGTVQTNAVYG